MKPSAGAMPQDATRGGPGNPILLLLVTGTLIGFNFPGIKNLGFNQG